MLGAGLARCNLDNSPDLRSLLNSGLLGLSFYDCSQERASLTDELQVIYG